MVSQKSRDWLLNRPGRHPQARDVHIAPDRCPAGPSRPADNPAAGYGRMFPDLDGLRADVPALAAAGQPGGICAPAAAGAARLMAQTTAPRQQDGRSSGR